MLDEFADELTDLGEGACFNDARVEITRIMTAELEGQSIAISTGVPMSPDRVH